VPAPARGRGGGRAWARGRTTATNNGNGSGNGSRTPSRRHWAISAREERGEGDAGRRSARGEGERGGGSRRSAARVPSPRASTYVTPPASLAGETVLPTRLSQVHVQDELACQPALIRRHTHAPPAAWSLKCAYISAGTRPRCSSASRNHLLVTVTHPLHANQRRPVPMRAAL
jgi:hypothetical protein